jgi:hypothetical protein
MTWLTGADQSGAAATVWTTGPETITVDDRQGHCGDH